MVFSLTSLDVYIMTFMSLVTSSVNSFPGSTTSVRGNVSFLEQIFSIAFSTLAESFFNKGSAST